MADTISTKRITDLPEDTDVNDNDLFMAGSNGTASLRKKKWSTLLAKIKSVLLANNLTTTTAGYALDARQGKALKDQLDQQNTNISSLQNSTDKMGVYDVWANDQTTFNVVFKVPQNGGQYRPAFLIMGNAGGTPFMLICTVTNLGENLVAATCVDIAGDVSSRMTVNVNANLGDPSQLRIQIITPVNMGSRIQVLVPAGQITGQW